jgi:hypothetical protein
MQLRGEGGGGCTVDCCPPPAGEMVAYQAFVDPTLCSVPVCCGRVEVVVSERRPRGRGGEAREQLALGNDG